MTAPSVLPDAASRKGAVDLPGVILFFVAAIVAFLLYRPDTDAPFEIIDFSETLPFLTDGKDFGDRFARLVGYYLQHGRAAFALSAGLAAKWTLFEWWTPGWQWTRYFVSLAVVVLSWHLLRALGANRIGAAFGASLFVVSETVATGWLRPSVNEPFGTLLLLSASLLACRYQQAVAPVRLALAIAMLLGAMIVVKETLVAATFFPIVLATCRGADGWMGRPVFSSRNRTLLGFSVVTIAIAAIPVLWALTQATPDGYARQFGAGGSLLSNAVFGELPAVIPFTPVSQPPGWAATVADVAWLLVLMGALLAADRGETPPAHQRVLFLTALALPVARAVAYLPWPLQFPYYSIPFLLGVAIVSAIGMTRLTQAGSFPRVASIVSALVVIAYASSAAGAQASRYFALRRLTDAWVSELHALSRDSSVSEVIVAVPRTKEQAWTGLGPTLSRFAAATGRPLPSVRDVSCREAESLSESPPAGTVLTALRHHCALPASGSGPMQVARRFDFATLHPVLDSVRVQIIRPAR
jgi:hypothetical protein